MSNKRRKKGSLTVEASLIVPMCVMVMALTLSLSFYVYLRCWYTQAVCESSIQGSAYGVLWGRDGKEKAAAKWNSRKKDSGFSEKRITGDVLGNKKEIQIVVSGKTPVWGRKELQFEIKVRQKIIRPVSFVRKAAGFIT